MDLASLKGVFHGAAGAKDERLPVVKPLNNPGESLLRLREQVREKLFDRLLTLGGFFAFATFETLRVLIGFGPSVPLAVILWCALAAYLAYFVRKAKQAEAEMHALKVGYEGEKFVGQFLEEFRRDGCRVYHDVQGDGFNIDHVMASPKCVFTIETKARSKDKGHIVEYRGDAVSVNGGPWDSGPVDQALAQAKWFREHLRGMTGREFDVRPVVLYPGWFVKPVRTGAQDHVWVMNEKVFRNFHDGKHSFLDEKDLALLDYSISQFIRYNLGGGGGKR